MDIVGNTLGEVPDVPSVEPLCGEGTVLVNTSQEKRSIVDKTPFSLWSCVIITPSSNGQFWTLAYHSVPVQLPNSTFLQMLLSPRDVMALRKVLKNLFPRPSAREKPCLRVRKAPFDIRNVAVVGARGTEVVRVLEVQGFVGATLMSKISKTHR